jgi:hypothetical protein
MPRKKLLISILLALLLLATQAVYVGAAPVSQEDTPITGSVDSIVVETDPETGEATRVAVTLISENEEPQTIYLSLDTAFKLGYVIEDDTGNFVENPEMLGESVEIDPTVTLSEEQEKEHPVGSAVSEFFGDLLGVDYDTIMEYHDDGNGFGVIAQALWMTNALEGDTEMFRLIMDAKHNHDYSSIVLPDGSEPKNWGQFRKAVMSDKDSSKNNLGAVMSGHAGQDGDSDESEKTNNGNGPDKVENNSNNGNGPDKDENNSNNGKAKGKDKNKGKAKGKGKDKNK